MRGHNIFLLRNKKKLFTTCFLLRNKKNCLQIIPVQRIVFLNSPENMHPPSLNPHRDGSSVESQIFFC